MKRYKMEYSCDSLGFVKIVEVEHSLGKWVRFEDIPSVECNCQREYEQPTGIKNKGMMFFNAWICPAHGFKRLC